MEIGSVILEDLIGGAAVALEIIRMVLIVAGTVWLLYRSFWGKKGILFRIQ